MKKNSAVRWHVLGWVVYVVYRFIGDFLAGKISREVYWVLFSVTLADLLGFYLSYLVIFPRLLRPGRVAALLGALGGVVVASVGFRYVVEELIFPQLLGFHNYSDGAQASHILFYGIYFAVPSIAASAALWAGQQALRRERENRQLTAEKQLAEVAFLKSQINPHFLYNTLNLLYGMAYPVARPLAAAILKLAELMRYMLQESPDGQVELNEEIDYLHNFLALYRLRFPDQFFVDFTITGAPDGHRIAPLLLIPFVENAFKHGVFDDAAHPVRIQLTISPEDLTFAVRNRISDYQKDASSGIGLPNLRRRLALLYPGRHTLRVGAENQQFDTLLQLVG